MVEHLPRPLGHRAGFAPVEHLDAVSYMRTLLTNPNADCSAATPPQPAPGALPGATQRLFMAVSHMTNSASSRRRNLTGTGGAVQKNAASLRRRALTRDRRRDFVAGVERIVRERRRLRGHDLNRPVQVARRRRA